MKTSITQVFLLCAILYSLVHAMGNGCADDICTEFYQAVVDYQHEKVGELLKKYGRTIIRDCKAWTQREEINKPGPLFIAAKYGNTKVVELLLYWDNNLCYEDSIFELFAEAVRARELTIPPLLLEYHKNRKVPQVKDRGWWGSYEDDALQAVASFSHESEEVKIFRKLYKYEKKFQKQANSRIEIEYQRLLNFVQTHKEKYADITYLVSMQRNKS